MVLSMPDRNGGSGSRLAAAAVELATAAIATAVTAAVATSWAVVVVVLTAAVLVAFLTPSSPLPSQLYFEPIQPIGFKYNQHSLESRSISNG